MPDPDLTSLHTAIIDRLSADFSATTVAAYPDLKRKITLPAVLVDLDEFDIADFGEDALGLNVRFTVYCVADPAVANAEMTVRNLAVTMALRIYQEKDFGYDVNTGAEIIRVSPDDFNPDLQGYLVWSVEFVIGITVGQEAYSTDPADGIHVTEMTIGDLDKVDMEHVVADGQEPDAKDTVNLPEQPKG